MEDSEFAEEELETNTTETPNKVVQLANYCVNLLFYYAS